MHRPWKSVLLTVLLSSTVASASFKQGEVIVKYKEGIVRTRSTMNVLYDSVKVKKVRHYSPWLHGLEQLTLDESVPVETAVAKLNMDSSVEFAQPNYILHILPVATRENREIAAAGAGSGSGAFSLHPNEKCWIPGIWPPGCDDSEDGGGTPTDPTKKPGLTPPPAEVTPIAADPNLEKAWGIGKIEAPKAWEMYRGNKQMIVADIDTGIDYNHEDLAFNVWRNPTPSDKSDVVGFDFVHNDGLPYDDQGHGTHTAGTIGAVGGNGKGISGVIQQVSLMALKFMNSDGQGTTADAIRAIEYAVAHGAKVLSNSWGGRGDPDNKALYDAINKAKDAGVLFVAAAGNSTEDNDNPDSAAYPAAFDNDNLISVAATDSSDGLASFSNYGKKTTHLAAPGVDVYSTIPGNRYKQLSGTSMACPHVAGAAALVWSKHPDWDYKKVKAALISSVDPEASLDGKVASGGRLNVLKAISVQ